MAALLAGKGPNRNGRAHLVIMTGTSLGAGADWMELITDNLTSWSLEHFSFWDCASQREVARVSAIGAPRLAG
jgi:hypothetical protein